MELPEEIKIFLLESYESLDKVEQDLVSLEKEPRNQTLLHGVFRAIHTIKGNAGFLGFSSLEQVCHSGESILDSLRAGKIQLSPDLSTALLSLVDFIRDELGEIERSGEDPKSDAGALLQVLAKFSAPR